MSRQILAIEIHHHSIAAVLLSAGLKSTSIVACFKVPFPDLDEKENSLETALATLAQKVSIEQIDVVVGLPADQTIYRTLKVPFKEEKKIRQILPFELEPNLPFAVDHLIIDYIITDGSAPGELLTAAIDRRHIDRSMQALEAVGLRPQLIVPGDFPLASAMIVYNDQMADQAIVLVLGLHEATLFLLDSKKISLIRSISADTATETGIETLALKIRQTLIAYGETSPGGFKPDVLYISGPASSDRTIAQRLNMALEITPQAVDLRNTASFLDVDPSLQAWDAAVFDGALAMAMVESEHLPCPSFHRTGSNLRNYWNAYRQYIRVPALLLVLVILLGLGGVLIESHLLQNQVDGIDRQIEEIFKKTFPDARRVGDPGDQMKSELKKLGTGSIDASQNAPQVRTIDILLEISRAIPKEADVLFTRLVLGSDGLTLSGETAAFNVVDDIKGRLEQSDLFKEVTIASANMEKSGSKVRFKLKLTL